MVLTASLFHSYQNPLALIPPVSILLQKLSIFQQGGNKGTCL